MFLEVVSYFYTQPADPARLAPLIPLPPLSECWDDKYTQSYSACYLGSGAQFGSSGCLHSKCLANGATRSVFIGHTDECDPGADAQRIIGEDMLTFLASEPQLSKQSLCAVFWIQLQEQLLSGPV